VYFRSKRRWCILLQNYGAGEKHFPKKIFLEEKNPKKGENPQFTYPR